MIPPAVYRRLRGSTGSWVMVVGNATLSAHGRKVKQAGIVRIYVEPWNWNLSIPFRPLLVKASKVCKCELQGATYASERAEVTQSLLYNLQAVYYFYVELYLQDRFDNQLFSLEHDAYQEKIHSFSDSELFILKNQNCHSFSVGLHTL